MKHAAASTAAVFGLSALLLLPSLGSAWGANGHRIVGRIAENHLTADARRGVEELLGPESLARAATWPDEIRSDPEWDHAKPWHYISIDDDETYETTEKNPEGDIVEAMRRFEKVLRDPASSREEKVVAIRFLVHFVGDVHQPLHVGRRADRGGNLVRVEWFGEPTNLHSVWDRGLIESERLSFTEFVRFIDHPTEEEVRSWQSAGYLDWVQESFDLRGEVYDFKGEKGSDSHTEEVPELSYEYAYRKLPIVRARLLEGGVRLAGLLNSIFASPR